MGRSPDRPHSGSRCIFDHRVKGLQIRLLPRAIKELFVNEKSGYSGEVSSFAALCTALSATIGTGNIVGVATALVAGGPGALFWQSVYF